MVVSLFALVVGLVFVAAPANAQTADSEAATSSTVLQVDATDSEMSVVLRSDDQPEVSAKVNGEDVKGLSTIPISADSRTPQVVLVMDTGDTTESDPDARSAVREAAAAITSSLRLNEQMAIVSTGGRSEIEKNFSSKAAPLTAEVTDGAAGGGRNAIWESVAAATDLFEFDRGINDIVLIVGSADEASDVTSATARGDAITASSRVHVIAYGDDTDEDLLAELVATTHGSFTKVSRSDEAVVAAEEIRNSLDNTFVTQFTSEAVGEGSSLELTIDGETTDLGYIPGSVSTGKLLEPGIKGESSSGLLTGTTALVLGLVLLGIAAALFIYATGSLVAGDTSLNTVLSPYGDDDGSGTAGQSTIVNSALFQSAVEATENFARRRGFLERVETMLERADMPLRAAEAMTFYIGIVVATLFSGLLLTQKPFTALIIGLFGAILPPAYVNFRAGRRRKAFMKQLPPALQLLSSTLKAGYSFLQGVEAVSREIEDPMGEELRRVISEATLGRPIEEALEASADRMDSADFHWAVLAVRIQREVGGNLAELLLTVSETMQAREVLRREVAALTAEGRVSAIVLGILPPGLGIAMWMINPDYMQTLFSETVGQMMLGASIIMSVLGFWWMYKIVDIEI